MRYLPKLILGAMLLSGVNAGSALAVDASFTFTTPAGVISKLAGTAPTPGSTDGTTAALFNAPSGIALDSANNVYVADTSNNTIRKISTGGTVTTLAGLAGRSSSVDGSATSARFEEPYSVATDGTYVYVADSTDHSIRKISADGTVTTLAGKAGTFGSSDGSGSTARFSAPRGIAADSTGTIYVADSGNSTIRKITSAGVVSTLAGTAGSRGNLDATGSAGYANGNGAAAMFKYPSGLTVDSAGNVYVADTDNHVYVLTGGNLIDLNLLSNWMVTAGCQ